MVALWCDWRHDFGLNPLSWRRSRPLGTVPSSRCRPACRGRRQEMLHSTKSRYCGHKELLESSLCAWLGSDPLGGDCGSTTELRAQTAYTGGASCHQFKAVSTMPRVELVYIWLCCAICFSQFRSAPQGRDSAHPTLQTPLEDRLLPLRF